jgi:hypothetical protein
LQIIDGMIGSAFRRALDGGYLEGRQEECALLACAAAGRLLDSLAARADEGGLCGLCGLYNLTGRLRRSSRHRVGCVLRAIPLDRPCGLPRSLLDDVRELVRDQSAAVIAVRLVFSGIEKDVRTDRERARVDRARQAGGRPVVVYADVAE